MGGLGSGNPWRYGAKSTTDDYRTLDVRRWAREGMLRPRYWSGWQWTRNGETVASIQMRAEYDRVILIYRHRSGGGEWKGEQYPVRIVRTPCNLGGSRPWFICPAVGCGRRVAILYGGHLRVPALLSARLRQLTGDRRRPGNKACGQAPSAARLGTRHSQWRGRQAEVDALAHI
jgi:hypothetical protein